MEKEYKRTVNMCLQYYHHLGLWACFRFQYAQSRKPHPCFLCNEGHSVVAEPFPSYIQWQLYINLNKRNHTYPIPFGCLVSLVVASSIFFFTECKVLDRTTFEFCAGWVSVAVVVTYLTMLNLQLYFACGLSDHSQSAAHKAYATPE